MTLQKLTARIIPMLCALLIGSCLMAATKRLATAKPSQCLACHDTSPLPKNHTDTKGLTYTDCRGCHEKGTKTSLVGKLPLMHVHLLNGITCAQCHGKGKPAPVDSTQCKTCHEQKALTEKTSKLKPQNPHESPHGYHEDCNLCHHQHTKSESFCATCHAFDFVVP